MLAEIGGPCCHLRPRCRHNAYVTLGNAHMLRLLKWPEGGLLDVVFAVQFQKISFAVVVLRFLPQGRSWNNPLRQKVSRDALQNSNLFPGQIGGAFCSLMDIPRAHLCGFD